jgi:CheY-like chemotaxis protein
LLRHLLPAAVHLVVEVPEGYDPWLIGHSGQLLQVLMNLATNARDAMPQGGKLRIALCPDDEAESPRRGKPSRGFAKLIVEDNGCGIPRESLSRVFDPFFTTKPRERGTGLGLSIVQGIVTDHNGSIAVESTPGVGTRFTLRFPTCPPDPNRATTARPQPCAKGDGETVLIVEDNDLVRALLATAIREAGFCPLQAGDGEEALRLFHTEAARLHLVVLDCDLPKRSGPEVLEEIRRTRPDLPAIMISGDASAPRAALGFSKTLFLSKPFSMAKLTAAMMETLQSAKAAKST